MTTKAVLTAVMGMTAQLEADAWQPMSEAPTTGETIVGRYEGGECLIFWSERPVCMLGSRCGGFPPGWATAGDETDFNLPMDEPDAWRTYKPAEE